MEEVEVRADYDPQVIGPFLPDVEGTRINAGKKTSNIRLAELEDGVPIHADMFGYPES
jgi:hypothetical protein